MTLAGPVACEYVESKQVEAAYVGPRFSKEEPGDLGLACYSQRALARFILPLASPTRRHRLPDAPLSRLALLPPLPPRSRRVSSCGELLSDLRAKPFTASGASQGEKEGNCVCAHKDESGASAVWTVA